MTVHLINIKFLNFRENGFITQYTLVQQLVFLRHLSNTLFFAEAHLANNALSGIPQFEIHRCYTIKSLTL